MLIRFRWKKLGTTWEPPGWRHPKNTSRILPTRPAAVHSISTPCRRSWRFDCSINILCFSMVCKSLLCEHPAVLCSTKRTESRRSRGNPSRTSDSRGEDASRCLILARLQNLSLFRCSIRITLNKREKRNMMKNLPRTKCTASSDMSNLLGRRFSFYLRSTNYAMRLFFLHGPSLKPRWFTTFIIIRTIEKIWRSYFYYRIYFSIVKIKVTVKLHEIHYSKLQMYLSIII